MEENNIVISTCYLEFINNLDNLLWELLYSQSGYMNLKSKEAVIEANKILERFDFEANKLKKDVDFEKADEIIEEKREEFIEIVKNHYQKQAVIWANDIYENLLDNCLLNVTLHKNNPDMVDKIYNRALSGVSWISEVNKFSAEDKKILSDILNKEFKNALNSKDSDFVPLLKAEKSDPKLFVELRELVLKDENKFVSADFEKFSSNLAQDDILFLNKIKNDLKTFKRTSAKDDILMINSAINLLKLRNFEDKYKFIKEVDGDINIFLSKNKSIDEKDKIEIIKRRLQLFKDYKNPEEVSSYYKNLIIS